MITREFFNDHFGDILDKFTEECGCAPTFVEEDGECLQITYEWITPHQLKAWLTLYLEEEGLTIMAFLNRQDIPVGRLKSWNTPPSKMLARMREVRDTLNWAKYPPIWTPSDGSPKVSTDPGPTDLKTQP